MRIALNQDFWLPGSPLSDPNYPALVDDAIPWAEMAGMDVFLDLHWSDRGVLGSCPPSAGCQQLMPDANSLTFWSQVAARYQNDGRVAFELYNEPHDVRWDVWRNGGPTFQGWQAVGMQQLYDAVRATGAQNLVVIGGLDWAYDLSGVPANRITGYNIVYATHPYTSTDGTLRPPSDWDRAFGSLTRTDPVVATEFGVLNDTACTTDYDSQLIQYADAHFAGWTAWAWYPGGCTFPAIVNDWAGTPSATGAVVQTALLGYHDPPASPPLPSPGPPRAGRVPVRPQHRRAGASTTSTARRRPTSSCSPVARRRALPSTAATATPRRARCGHRAVHRARSVRRRDRRLRRSPG